MMSEKTNEKVMESTGINKLSRKGDDMKTSVSETINTSIKKTNDNVVKSIPKIEKPVISSSSLKTNKRGGKRLKSILKTAKTHRVNNNKTHRVRFY